MLTHNLCPGGAACEQLVVRNSSVLQCSAPGSVVGKYPVVVSLNGVNSTSPASSLPRVYRLCGKDKFGMPGARCGGCPEVGWGSSTVLSLMDRHRSSQPHRCCDSLRCIAVGCDAECGVRRPVPGACPASWVLRTVPNQLSKLCTSVGVPRGRCQRCSGRGDTATGRVARQLRVIAHCV
jgi:hypothetical protein